MLKSRFVADLPWDLVRDRLQNGAAAILPVGASSKAHGLHLPLAADSVQAEYFAAYAAERADGLVWPVLAYGYYPAFTSYAGSASLSRDTFVALVGDLLDALCAQTPSRVFVIDTGISTISPVGEAIARCRSPGMARHVPIYSGLHFLETKQRLEEQQYGGHADEIETSIMLAIAPELVDMSKARPLGVEKFGPGALNPTNPQAPNYAPTGGTGDPTLATRDKGDQLVAAIKRDIDDICASF